MSKALNDFDRKVIYRARRGLKELDFYINPYINTHYADSSDQEKQVFARLVEQEDPDLLNWFMDVETPQDKELASLIVKIRQLKQF